MKKLVDIAFLGGFSGGGSYFRWECGSWLDQKVKEKIKECEEVSGTPFLEVVKEVGKKRPYEQWEEFVDSYLIIPVSNYKKKSYEEKTDVSGLWAQAFQSKRNVFLKKAFMKPIDIDLNLPLVFRFEQYLKHVEHRKSFAKYFGKRLQAAQIEDFQAIFDKLDFSLKNELIVVFSGSGNPFWKIFSKVLRKRAR